MGMFYSLLSNTDEILENQEENEEVTSEMNLANQKGAYFFQDDEKRIYNFLFFRLQPDDLQKALPITYEKDTKRNYLIVIFDAEGKDYLGQHTWESVQNFISLNRMVNLITTPWIEIKDEYEFEEKEYQNMVKFATEQLK